MKSPLNYLRKIPFSSAVFLLYILVAVITTLQGVLGHLKSFEHSDQIYTSYNNYIIFRNSFFHLIHGKNLYTLYLNEQWDLYKYSPSFSLLMGILAYLPDFIGLLSWNLLNSIPILIGFRYLHGVKERNKCFALLFCLMELSNNMQNSQSNGLMAGLIILTFTSLENKNYFTASLWVVLSVYLKIYGGIAFVFFLFYPSKWKLLRYTVFWFVIVGALPLLAISLHQLLYLYQAWWGLLKADQTINDGISVAGILHSWFNMSLSKNIISFSGLVLFLLPFLRSNKYKDYHFRLLILCSALIWIVIFNHKAESPTYIIALLGVSLWYFTGERTGLNTALFILTLIFTTLSVSDLVPGSVRDNFVVPYCIKAVMPIIIWIIISIELLFRNSFVFVITESPDIS